MKKVTALIMVIVLVTLLFVPVGKAAGEKFAFSLSSARVPAGNECPVTLSVDANPGMASGVLNIVYDYTKVAFARYEKAGNFSADVISVVDNKYGQVRFAFLSSRGLMKDVGKAITLYFTLVSGTQGESEISIKVLPNSIYDGEYSPSGYTCQNATATFFEVPFWVGENSPYNLDIENRLITGVLPSTTPQAFSGNFGGSFSLVSNTVFIATGNYIEAGSKKYYIVIKGDIYGDGIVGVMDYISLRLYLLGIQTLSPVSLLACDADSNGSVSVTDYISIRLHILGINDLFR
jgi:hypothetical protein